MADTDAVLRNIRQRISNAQSTRARAQVERDNAAARLKEARSRLKEEFSVETGEDAKRVKQELDSALDSAVQDVQRALTEAGA